MKKKNTGTLNKYQIDPYITLRANSTVAVVAA